LRRRTRQFLLDPKTIRKKIVTSDDRRHARCRRRSQDPLRAWRSVRHTPLAEVWTLKAQAVVFDLFGTLVPGFSTVNYDSVVAAMAADLGVPPQEFNRAWNDEMWPDRVVGRFADAQESIVQACRAFGASPPPEAVERALLRRLDYERSLLVPFPDVFPTFDRLHRAGIAIGLISNCAMELVPIWDETELAARVDVAILSAAVHLAKPDPRIYRLACEKLGVPLQRSLYVGDGSDGELRGAAAVGMRPVLKAAPLAEAYDPQRDDVNDWSGPTIVRIAEVLSLLG